MVTFFWLPRACEQRFHFLILLAATAHPRSAPCPPSPVNGLHLPRKKRAPGRLLSNHCEQGTSELQLGDAGRNRLALGKGKLGCLPRRMLRRAFRTLQEQSLSIFPPEISLCIFQLPFVALFNVLFESLGAANKPVQRRQIIALMRQPPGL